jgi:hypothetical protein
VTPARRIAAIGALVLTAVPCACGGTASSSSSARVAEAAESTVASASAPAPGLGRSIAIARHVYGNEVNGGRVHHDLQLIASDPALLEDLARGDLTGARAEAMNKMLSNRLEHITRVSVVNGGRVLLNAVWNENGVFVVAPLKQSISFHGWGLGTLLVSVQDVVGYVKLVHKFTGAEVVVRGASGQVRSSLPAAAHAALPTSGHVQLDGRYYEVGSFGVKGWGGETLTVWLLRPA